MKKIFIILILFPFFISGQTIYSGLHGKYNHKWTLKINPDSSIILIRKIADNGYEEYLGTISRTSDSVFNIKASLDFAQIICKAVGDLTMYVSLDSNYRQTIQNISIVYSNSEKNIFPFNNKDKIDIPLNKNVSRADPNKNFFYATVNHKNPIDNSEVRTQYKNKDSYCLEFFHKKSETFQVVIRYNKIRKIGKGNIDNFTLTKVSQ